MFDKIRLQLNRRVVTNMISSWIGVQCVMVLINNVATSKGDQYLNTQQYTIFIKVIRETIQIHLLQLYNKLSNVQLALKEVNSFPTIFIKIKLKVFSNSRKKNRKF